MTDGQSTENLNGDTEVSGEITDTGWYWADGMPGAGDRPEYLDARYKSLADQAKAYKELEKKFSAMSGAPDEYDLGNLNDLKEDASVQELLAYAKDNKLSQEGVSKFFHTFDKLAPTVDVEAELAKLGPNAKEITSAVETWINNSFPEKQAATARRIAKDAESVEFFNILRLQSVKGRSQPPHSGEMNSPIAPKKLSELKEEMMNAVKKGEYDPYSSYARDLRGRMEEAARHEES